MEALTINVFAVIFNKNETAKHSIEPWPNGVASRRKLKRGPNCQGLRSLALTCAHSGRDLYAPKSKQVFTVWPPNPSQRKLSDVP